MMMVVVVVAGIHECEWLSVFAIHASFHRVVRDYFAFPKSFRFSDQSDQWPFHAASFHSLSILFFAVEPVVLWFFLFVFVLLDFIWNSNPLFDDSPKIYAFYIRHGVFAIQPTGSFEMLHTSYILLIHLIFFSWNAQIPCDAKTDSIFTYSFFFSNSFNI